MFAEMEDEAAGRFGDPLRTGPGSFFEWLNQGVNVDRGNSDGATMLTRLWDAVYRARPDLQRVFPDPSGADRAAFLAWTTESGLREHGVSDCFATAPAAGR